MLFRKFILMDIPQLMCKLLGHSLPHGTWESAAIQEHKPCLQLLWPVEDRAVAVGLHGGHHLIHVPGTDGADKGRVVKSVFRQPVKEGL